MEFGLHEELHSYAGGLGVLAGDFMKSAGDLGLPVVGVGLRWSQGYTSQHIGADGYPYDEWSEQKTDGLTDTGARVRVRVAAREVECRVWRVGRYAIAPLYLLEPTDARDAWITRRLYDPRPDCRVAQEMLLGIGGVRALRALHLPIERYHFNEGHAVFAGVELIADRMETGASFREAWRAARASIVFTTHTPVPAGNEVHALSELRRLGAGCELVAGELAEIGGDPFNMTVAGLRLAHVANAVAQLHGETARAMWAHVESAAPIIAITNGVHPGTWQDPRIVGAQGSDERLLAVKHTLKAELFAEVLARTGTRLDPDALTIGFARRFATYKRAPLIFRDFNRLAELLHNADRPVQLVFAGKAHPRDDEGKRFIQQIVAHTKNTALLGKVVFLENYDINVARHMISGVDVWLNTPRRPMEASGTSGMKILIHGGLNLSILDGWWCEGCDDRNGWAIGTNQSPLDPDVQDEQDALSLYETLEKLVVPEFYDRDEYGIPRRWLERIRHSMVTLIPQFNTDRMVSEYVTKYYLAEH
jgi:starch phosphorylase